MDLDSKVEVTLKGVGTMATPLKPGECLFNKGESIGGVSTKLEGSVYCTKDYTFKDARWMAGRRWDI